MMPWYRVYVYVRASGVDNAVYTEDTLDFG